MGLSLYFYTIFCIQFVLSYNLTHSINSPNLTLKKSLVFYRHGNRNPITTFPKDKYKSLYENNFGRLTIEGMRTEFALGRKIYNRYVSTLISKKYSHLEVYIKSSSEERCLQSAYTQLAGLFPPDKDQVWNDTINWQPIAVYSSPFNKDPLLRSYEDNCPNRDKIVKNLKKSPKYINIIDGFKDTFIMLSQLTGMTINFDNTWILSDVLKIEKEQGLELPDWFDLKTQYSLRYLNDLAINITFWGDGEEEFLKIVGGPILSEIIEILQNDNNNIKLHLYSGHDTTLASLKAVFDLPVLPFDEYGSAYAIELYQLSLSEKTLYVQLYSFIKDAIIRLPKCSDPCSLNAFINAYSSRKSISRIEECDSLNKKVNLYMILFYCSLCFLILIGIVVIIRTIRATRRMGEPLLSY